MARDPEYFRGMTPSQIIATLLIDESTDKHTQAKAVGAKCINCMDTGMNGGSFCGCAAGAKISFQSNAKRPGH